MLFNVMYSSFVKILNSLVVVVISDNILFMLDELYVWICMCIVCYLIIVMEKGMSIKVY